MFPNLKQKESTSIHVNEIDGLMNQINLIDVREVFEFETGSIQSAQNIPMNQLIKMPEKYLEKEKKYYVMCQSGMRSARTVAALQKAGYEVVQVRGGVGGYTGRYRINKIVNK
ncbi:MAG: rhodanese domain protein [Herbinix sp.]|jgi:rhodanese-related sulfurtransferase|nr:rhodanese domain protein [Herbinix sp.]